MIQCRIAWKVATVFMWCAGILCVAQAISSINNSGEYVERSRESAPHLVRRDESASVQYAGTKIEYDVCIVNPTNKEVEIHGVIPSCGCVVAEDYAPTVPAGETVCIQATAKLAGSTRQYIQKINIVLGNGDVLTHTIHGEVVPIARKEVQLGRLKPGGGVVRHIPMGAIPNRPLVVERIVCSDDSRIAAVYNQDESRLEIRVMPGQLSREYSEVVAVHCGHEHIHQVHVTGAVEGVLRTEPMGPYMFVGDSREVKCVLTLETGAAFTVRKCSWERGDTCECRVAADDQTGAKSLVAIWPCEALNGTHRDILHIQVEETQSGEQHEMFVEAIVLGES